MSEKITLTGVPETMLQTVYARAKETKTRGAIHDEKAVELVEKLDYDFSLADKDTPMHSGVIARTIVLDRLVKEFLEQHPGAIVVNIACGLDTRCYRLNGYTHWYNLDLPETIAVREKLLPESGCVTAIAQSAMEPWGNQIKEQDVPVLIIIEGLTMYLTEADVKQIFAVISERFLQATVLVETMNPAVVKRFKEKSIDASNAKFTWGMYIYPDNLSAKATLWLWELRDIGIIGVGLLLSVLALTQTGIALPLVLTAVFAFLTIRHEGTSILDFIRYAAAFLITKQQYYEWRLDP